MKRSSKSVSIINLLIVFISVVFLFFFTIIGFFLFKDTLDKERARTIDKISRAVRLISSNNSFIIHSVRENARKASLISQNYSNNIDGLLSCFLDDDYIIGIGYISANLEYNKYLFRKKQNDKNIFVRITDIIPNLIMKPWFLDKNSYFSGYRISPPTLDKFHLKDTYMSTFTFPVQNKGENYGLLLIDIPTKKLLDDLEKDVDVSVFTINGSRIFGKNIRKEVLNSPLKKMTKNEGKYYYIDTALDKTVLISVSTSINYYSLYIRIIALLSSLIFLYFIVILIFLTAFKIIFKNMNMLFKALLNLINDDLSKPIHINTRITEVKSYLLIVKKIQYLLRKSNIELEKLFFLKGEIKAAKKIQNAILPKQFNQLKKFKKFTFSQTLVPCRDIGGDFYNYFMVDNENIFISIGDVSDKGVSSGIFAAKLLGVEGSLLKYSSTLEEFVYGVNNELCINNELNYFASYCCLSLNLKTGEFKYVLAGHPPPIKISLKGANFLEKKKGPLLGLFSNSKYEVNEGILNNGDSLLLYTDGVTEARDSKGNFLGDKLLLNNLKKLSVNDEAVNLNNFVIKLVNDYSKNQKQEDDITIFSITRLK